MSEAAAPEQSSAPRRVVGVQFRRAAAMIYDFDARDLSLGHDACVVVETERGEALGWTVGEPEDREPHTDGVLRRIIRVASNSDETRREELRKREREALRFCAHAARARNLPMKVIAVEWAHSGEKAAFYFSSEERIDFRELVRELAQKFRIRVEMRQVGPRDEAKIIGAMGPCGRETCCSSWMRAFTPVSIKMAKDQGLSITPAKVTGVCGRLLCCLAYEQDTYKELRRKLPRLGKQVVTPRGNGRIIDVLALREAVRVILEEGGPPVEFAATEVRPVGSAAPVVEEPETEGETSDALDDLPATPAPTPTAKPGPQAPPRIGRDRRDRPPPRHGGEKPAAAAPTSARPERSSSEARPPQGRPPRPERPPEQRRDQRPPRPPRAQQDGSPPSPGGPQNQRPNRPPRPPQQQRPPQPPRAPPPVTDAPGGPAEPKPPQENSGAVREGGRHRHRHRRRGGGGGGGGGTPAPSGGGTPPPGPGAG